MNENDIMAGARRESAVEFADELVEKSQEEMETPTDSPAENNQEEESPSQEGEEEESDDEGKQPESEEESEDTPEEETLPFHKHPRWKQMYDENKQMRQMLDELNSTTKSVAEKVQNLNTNQEPIPPELAVLLGDNPEAYKAWQAAMENQKKTILSTLEEREKQQKQREEQQIQAIVQAVNEVEENYNVKLPRNSSEYNAFLKFMDERRPMNSDGSLNFIGGWQWYQEVKGTKKDVKKAVKRKVASMTTSEPISEEPESDVQTLDNFPWFGN